MQPRYAYILSVSEHVLLSNVLINNSVVLLVFNAFVPSMSVFMQIVTGLNCQVHIPGVCYGSMRS